MTTAGASALAKPARTMVPSPGRAAILLAANAARVARKEAGLIAAAVKAARPLVEAFADHAGFCRHRQHGVSADTVAVYTAATIARAESLLAADPPSPPQQWVDQTAAPLQLES